MSNFCWWCGKELASTYATVGDPIGNLHKVHKSCKEPAELNAKPISAAERDFPEENADDFSHSFRED